ncbi:MAG: serine/threonine protein kinase [Planctomycetaceae bacterium]|nr:serine/threonine protein kinase [Planctomycetaceae bacterium]
MTDSQTHCDDEQLQAALADQLSGEAEEGLTAHLAQCQACRVRLEQLAGQPVDWSRIEHALSGSRVDVHPELHGEDWTNLADFAVSFLQPCDETDKSEERYLGRLGTILIRDVIGHGGNGLVLRGFQKELNRMVAVKVMAPQLAASAAARHRFAREARATAAIAHPNVMPILSVDSTGPLPYLVMPYMECESLQQRLQRTGSLPTQELLQIAIQVVHGLTAAHALGLVHRDVKPANILLERGVDRVVLTDFGLARASDDASLTRTGLIAGTPQYMSPEQARGELIDIRSDLFSLGSVMYAMATGRPPFRAETSYGILRRVVEEQPRAVTELNPEMPRWLERIIFRLLAKTPRDRFQTTQELAGVLERCLAHVRQPERNPLPVAVAGDPFVKRQRVPLIAICMMISVIAGVFGIQVVSRSFSQSPPVVSDRHLADGEEETSSAVIAETNDREVAGPHDSEWHAVAEPDVGETQMLQQWSAFNSTMDELEEETETLWRDVMTAPQFPESSER